jgi:hypothetical protein
MAHLLLVLLIHIIYKLPPRFLPGHKTFKKTKQKKKQKTKKKKKGKNRLSPPCDGADTQNSRFSAPHTWIRPVRC